MKEFILSLVSPLKIKKYRFMTVFIAMFIFVVSVYLVAIPNQMYMKINKDLYLSQKIYVSAYIDLPEEKLPAEFIAEKYKINDEYKMVSASNTKEIQKYYFENIEVKLYEEEMKSINIHIVFDLDNSVDTKLKAIREKYVQLYPDDSDNRKTYSAYITFVEYIKLPKEEATDSWIENKFKELKETEDKVLEDQMRQLSNFDLFNININETENNYLLMFFKDYAVSQDAYYDQQAEKITYPSIQVIYSDQNLKFDFSDKTTLTEFGNYFAQTMFKPLSSSDQTNYLLQVVGYVILFPAIFVLLLCWSMRKRGVMKTYKEYYNVSAISSIIPAIITFIIGWFVPMAATIYGALFCLFTLFVYIKINSTPELGD